MKCRLRKRLVKDPRATVSAVVVGDRVELEEISENEGVIEVVLPRSTKLSRQAPGSEKVEQILVSNADTLLIIFSTRSPQFNNRLVDRFAVSGEAGGLNISLCLNKVDLGVTSRVKRHLECYEAAGYECLPTSTVSGEGLDDLRELMSGKFTVMVGPSGSGKTSILNYLQPGLGLRVREVSKKTQKGRHTTSAASAFDLNFGGYVVDTPGLRAFAPWGVKTDDLRFLFPEMRTYEGQCRYRGCIHMSEPECAVKEAVDGGAICLQRYQSYAKMIQSM